MKLIIDISENIYQEAITSGYSYMYDEEVANAVAEGIPLDNVIPDYACGTCKYASIHCTLHDNEVASSDGCGDWEDD